jgi:oligoendopeptidase F
MVLEGFDRFAPEMGRAARRILDARRVDAEVRHGKRAGAFCMSVAPGMEPWVLMNYTGAPREVATMAHEFGHGIHSLLAADHSIMTFHPALPMAETASVFSEMLLTDLLLERQSDPLGRRDLLMGVIDDIYATVLRQAFFVLFEREAHRAVVEGASVEDLHAIYARNLAVQFGDAVDIDACFRYEWVSIPHIFNTPFYCYAYCFGQLLSLSLYQRYREKGPSFAPELFRILAYGGSAKPERILGEAGIDIADEEFWRSGFRVIQSLVEDLKGLG